MQSIAMDSLVKILVQMSGAPGAGKSTIGGLLARSINAVVIDHDLLKSFFLENSNAFDQSAELAYSLQWVLAEALLKQGRNVIIDSTCNFQETLDGGTALARNYGFDYWYIECRVLDIDVLEKRLRARVPLRSQRTGVNTPSADANDTHRSVDSRTLFKRWIENPVRPASNAIIIDSTASPEDCLECILKQIALLKSLQASTDGVQTNNRANPCFPARLSGASAFSSSNPVPEIFPSGHGYMGEHTTLDAIIRNEP